MTDARKFLLNTDYPMDKVIYMKSGSFSATGGGGAGTIVQFAHNLGFTPLIIGTWSGSSTFTTTHESVDWLSFEMVDPSQVSVTFFSNGTNITISCYNPGSTTTIYYRIIGLMPTNVNVAAAETQSLADKFMLNTDYNYTKLIPSLSGISAATASRTITHNLGYRPQVLAWAENYSVYGTMLITASGYVQVNNSSIIITSPSNNVHYRTYADGQI